MFIFIIRLITVCVHCSWFYISDTEATSCEYGSGKYYALCGFGGILSCGITHTAVVPLDLVKCRIQVDPGKYGGIVNGFRVTLKESGIRELGKGWAPTFFGYSMQGLGKFGFYEVFKHVYADLLGEVRTAVCKAFHDKFLKFAAFFALLAKTPPAVKIMHISNYQSLLCMNYFAPRRGAKYYDPRVCLSSCTFVSKPACISRQPHAET